MPAQDNCVNPEIGARIKEYMTDVDAPSGEKRLTFEEATMLEIHLLRCPFCRRKLNLKSRLHLETMLILSGLFIDDPVLLKKRKRAVKKFFQDKMSLEDFKAEGLNVSTGERRKLKALWRKDG